MSYPPTGAVCTTPHQPTQHEQMVARTAVSVAEVIEVLAEAEEALEWYTEKGRPKPVADRAIEILRAMKIKLIGGAK